MSKLQENMKKLQKEGILTSVLRALTKAVNKMSDDSFNKAKKQYNKETAAALEILRKYGHKV